MKELNEDDDYWKDRNYDHALVAVMASIIGIILSVLFVMLMFKF